MPRRPYKPSGIVEYASHALERAPVMFVRMASETSIQFKDYPNMG
jgi:hypothetical protein